jgi:glyoxylase-like metal-dependent hydrolase (beta-lactamase superfamily II)
MSQADEDALSYPLGHQLPAPGATLEVAPGVRWLRMALPFALDHINLWLLRDRIDGRDGWTAVDCGIDNADTRARWQQVFDSQLDGLPLLRVLVTHMHPDHVGLAQWLTERWSTPGHECRLWMSAADYQTARLATQATSGVGGDAAAAFFAQHGLTDPDALERVRARRNHFSSLVPGLPPRYRRLMDGQVLRIGGHDWTCLAGHGHAPEHISLHAPALGVLISGDMVLPRISTNVSVGDTEPEADPLALYLASIERMRALPADTRVLPSHGRPFVGLHTTHRPVAAAPRRTPGRRAGRLPRRALQRGRTAAGAVQAQPGPAPDHVRNGRSSRSLARLGQQRQGARGTWG